MDRREDVYEVANDKLSDRRAEFAVAFRGLKASVRKSWSNLKKEFNGNAGAIANAEQADQEIEWREVAEKTVLSDYRRRALAQGIARTTFALAEGEELHYTVEPPKEGADELHAVVGIHLETGSAEVAPNIWEEMEDVS